MWPKFVFWPDLVELNRLGWLEIFCLTINQTKNSSFTKKKNLEKNQRKKWIKFAKNTKTKKKYMNKTYQKHKKIKNKKNNNLGDQINPTTWI